MNKILKYFLYFLLGFILYLLLNNKIIEGFENELSLLFNVLKDRTDIGCHNYKCQQDEYYINPYSIWRTKINVKDESFFLCNNSPEYSLASTLNTGNRCHKELCCQDISCNKKFFNKGLKCNNRIELYNNECPLGFENEDCVENCCGFKLEGPGQILYDSIRQFKEQIFQNSKNSETECNKSMLKNYSLDNPNIVSLLDLRNYQYFNTLDF